jgi:hypothetical protein
VNICRNAARGSSASWQPSSVEPSNIVDPFSATTFAVDQRARLNAEIREDLRRRHDNLLDTAGGKWGAAMNDVDDVARELKAIQAGIAVEQISHQDRDVP